MSKRNVLASVAYLTYNDGRGAAWDDVSIDHRRQWRRVIDRIMQAAAAKSRRSVLAREAYDEYNEGRGAPWEIVAADHCCVWLRIIDAVARQVKAWRDKAAVLALPCIATVAAAAAAAAT